MGNEKHVSKAQRHYKVTQCSQVGLELAASVVVHDVPESQASCSVLADRTEAASGVTRMIR